jgi:hypothetical protein
MEREKKMVSSLTSCVSLLLLLLLFLFLLR